MAAPIPPNAYRMHVSQRYLDLTRQKLELTRLPRDPRERTAPSHETGVLKNDLEPLIDHWIENYDWRGQESHYNEVLPQFRILTYRIRLHFVHKRSDATAAIPLLVLHGWPDPFIAVAPMIDALCNPVAPTPQSNFVPPAFHVVAPSIPGFGFSDAVNEDANNVEATATIFDSLMKSLGYRQYLVHGSGWAFKICRVLALKHGDSCLAVHTVNPEAPPPPGSPAAYPNVQYNDPRFPTNSPSPWTPSEPHWHLTRRPQTIAHALADSPSGLLALVLDAVDPAITPNASPQQNRSIWSAAASPSTAPSNSPLSVSTPLISRVGTPHARSPQSSQSGNSGSDPGFIHEPWSPTNLVTWTMLQWLPGPEAALRWLAASAKLESSLWVQHSHVPLGITIYRDSSSGMTAGSRPSSLQWLEAYHRIALLVPREGKVRFASWERPDDVVQDIRELANRVGFYPR